MIRAKAADGSIHEFPDGTKPAVVDKVMRQYAQNSAAYQKGKRDAKSGKTRGLGGEYAITAAENLPFVDEVQAGLAAGGLTLMGGGGKGKGVVDRFKTNYGLSREYQRGVQDGFRERSPVLHGLTVGQGFALQAIPAMASGGASVAAPAAKNLFARSGQFLTDRAKDVVTGAGVSALNAFAGRGDLQERVQAANNSIVPGAVAGVVAPAIMGTPRVIRRTGEAVARGPVGRTTVRAVNNAAERVTGKGFLDPRQEAMKRLGETLKADGLNPEQISAAINEWTRVGGPSPAFMDIVAKNGGGQQTMALIRGSAMKGPGRTVATKYGDQVAADLQDNAIARTRQLVPNEQRPAAEVAADMRKTRSRLATEQYAGPYQTQVPLTDDVRSVLTDAPGKAALRQARADALERRDLARVAEIDAILGDAPDHVSAATLDRAQIAMRERGDKLSRAGNNSRASGSFERRNVINSTLDQVPELAEARRVYRDMSQGIEGVEKVGPRVLNATPDAYAADVARLGEPGLPGTRIGAARSVEDAIGRPAEGATGVLNRLSTATNPGRNLRVTFGDQAANDYRQAIAQMVEQVNNARFINPNGNSQTAGRLADEALVDNIPSTKIGLLKALVDKVRSGATLSPAEQEAIVQIATSRGGAPEGLDQVFMPPPPRVEGPRFNRANLFAIPMAQENRP